jgi:hypothetical protein
MRVYAHRDRKRYPMGSSWRSSGTCRSCVCTHHVKEIAHSCSHACMRARRQTRRTRSCRHGGGAAQAAPRGVAVQAAPPVYTQHTKETAHSCSYACMRTRRQASCTRLRRSWRSSSTCRSQIYTPHVLETAHSCSHARMRERRPQARPAASSWRSTMTEYSQIRAQHIMETAHRDSYARMRTRRQAKGTRWCHRGGAAAHAALESVLITSRR